jgi:hypothetical protein
MIALLIETARQYFRITIGCHRVRIIIIIKKEPGFVKMQNDFFICHTILQLIIKKGNHQLLWIKRMFPVYIEMIGK